MKTQTAKIEYLLKIVAASRSAIDELVQENYELKKQLSANAPKATQRKDGRGGSTSPKR